jgi:hypothetical protein
MDLPELQIDDMLRHLKENDNQESAPSLPHLMYQLRHLVIVSIYLSYCTQQEDGNPL